MKRFNTAYIQYGANQLSVCGWLMDAETGTISDLYCTGITEAENQRLLSDAQTVDSGRTVSMESFITAFLTQNSLKSNQ